MKKVLFALLLLTQSAYAEKILAGSTDVIVPLQVTDTSDQSELTGLLYNTSGLSCTYQREGSAVTAMTLVTATANTHTDNGFIATDGTNSPGEYQVMPPDAAFAAGVDYVIVGCHGATNMARTATKIYLEPFDGLLASESGTTLGLASGGVDADDQFNYGWAVVVYDSTGAVTARSCITDSVNSGDTIVTRQDISALVAVNDRYVLQPDAGCEALRPTVAERTVDITAAGEVDAGATGGGGGSLVSVD